MIMEEKRGAVVENHLATAHPHVATATTRPLMDLSTI